ncbi:relA-associated inhibitor-like isoform X2 [Xyrauchen texanus]|uniref:relA-associated inhibitor-like isoform X2 n=1 Tax=Xyrauchen texanus TaxID=154827 RepID=UPI0022421DD7|nr:relA-associated inhibitor-like isoform X2 [Xyrauchen texanus]
MLSEPTELQTWPQERPTYFFRSESVLQRGSLLNELEVTPTANTDIMNSHSSFGCNFMFDSINDELSASLTTADELSREFSLLLQESTPVVQTTTEQSSGPKSQNGSVGNSSLYSANKNVSENIQGSSTSSLTTVPSQHSLNSTLNRKDSNLDVLPAIVLGPSSPAPNLDSSPSPLTQQHSPFSSPSTIRRAQPMPLRPQNPRGLLSYREQPPISSPTCDNKTSHSLLQSSASPLAMYDSSSLRSSRLDRTSSPQPFNQPAASTLPRNFQPFRPSEEGIQREKSPSKWNETDLDVPFDRRPHQSYDKNEWIRPSVPNSNWKESNVDAPPSAKKDTVPHQLSSSFSSLPRNTHISESPDLALTTSFPYGPQPIISRISIPPATSGVRQHRPIPLSFIMRLQNPCYAADASRYAPGPVKDPQQGQHLPLPREHLQQGQIPQPQKQPAYYKEVLHPGDVEAELDRQDSTTIEGPVCLTDQSKKPEEEGKEDPEMLPRPLSPTRLQPVIAPEAELFGDLEDVMRIRAEFPRALKRRGSADVSQPLTDLPVSQPNYYKQMMNKMFRRKALYIKEEQFVTEKGNSSDGESQVYNSPKSTTEPPFPITEIQVISEQKSLHSILRKARKAKSFSRRARLSPLVLMLDGALVGELETVQRAAKEMSDPSQANDEGITALHNAICALQFPVVEFLVRIGANVSAQDSHGWTPLHCAASCNDRKMCEFLVRNGAAVMAVTDSDGATAAQKCDPYAPGFEECESFLKGVEEAMGVENSGVVYSLWEYPSQAPDELSFKEGDMVTILQKPEGVDWWWASLCGREGFVPNNYFGLFPKVRPKSPCKSTESR